VTRKVTFRRAAVGDLAKLYRHIKDSRGGSSVAISYVRRIRAYCERLADFPERGVKRDDIRPGLRIVGFERRVLIAFTIEAEHVRVGRIFYGGRDYEALFGAHDHKAQEDREIL
jgi:toxin ParE1/3/4